MDGLAAHARPAMTLSDIVGHARGGLFALLFVLQKRQALEVTGTTFYLGQIVEYLQVSRGAALPAVPEMPHPTHHLLPPGHVFSSELGKCRTANAESASAP